MKPHILFLLLSLSLISCTQDKPTTNTTNSTETPAVAVIVDNALVQQGIEVYLAQYCGICHQLTAANTTGTFGPSHDGVASNAIGHLQSELYAGAATNAAEYLRESLLDPKAYIVDGYGASSHQMPAYTFLTTEDIDALVYMLLQQVK